MNLVAIHLRNFIFLTFIELWMQWVTCKYPIYRYNFACNILHSYLDECISYIYIIWASSWDYGTYHIGDQYGSRRKVRPKVIYLAPLDCCACAFEEFLEDEKYHNLMSCLILDIFIHVIDLDLLIYTEKTATVLLQSSAHNTQIDVNCICKLVQ